MKVKTYKKWDLHHHIVPDFYVDEMRKLGISVAGIKWPTWNAKASIKMMDSFQIEKAFLSLSTPGAFFKMWITARISPAGATSLSPQ